LREKALSKLKALSKFTKGRVPLVAVGGIFRGEDVQERLDAGASLVQIYTSYIYEGLVQPKRLCRYLLKHPPKSNTKTLRLKGVR